MKGPPVRAPFQKYKKKRPRGPKEEAAKDDDPWRVARVWTEHVARWPTWKKLLAVTGVCCLLFVLGVMATARKSEVDAFMTARRNPT